MGHVSDQCGGASPEQNVPCPKLIGDLEILFLSNRLKEREIEQIADDNKKARESSEADNKKARD